MAGTGGGGEAEDLGMRLRAAVSLEELSSVDTSTWEELARSPGEVRRPLPPLNLPTKIGRAS